MLGLWCKVVQNYQVGLLLNTNKSVTSSVQAMVDGNIRIYVKLCVGIHQLVLKEIDFDLFYSSLRSYWTVHYTMNYKEEKFNGDF